MKEQQESADQVLLERIETISSQKQSSDMPGIFSRRDYMQAVIIMILCLCVVVAGAFLAA